MGPGFRRDDIEGTEVHNQVNPPDYLLALQFQAFLV